MSFVKQNEATAAYRTFHFLAVNTADDSAYTGGFSNAEIQILKNNGSPANSAGTITHHANGVYSYVMAQAETDTLGMIVGWINKSGVYGDIIFRVKCVVVDHMAASNFGLTNLDATVSSRLAGSAYQDIDDWLDSPNSIETGVTLRGWFRVIGAIEAGKVSGGGTGTEIFRNMVADTKARATSINDANGNRTSVTCDQT